jgi:hypothetical protein
MGCVQSTGIDDEAKARVYFFLFAKSPIVESYFQATMRLKAN